MQLAQPVTFACRAPTLSERKYSQIRKKLLAQVFGMEHNHHHVYVQKVILWTDHKPLVSISQKPLASVFKRLQCLLLRLQQYDCEIYYKPGKEMLLADTLSRAYSEDYERISHRIRGGVHPCHSLPSCSRLPAQGTSERNGLWSNSTVFKESNLGWLPRYKGKTTSSHSPVLWNPRWALSTWWCNIQGPAMHHKADPETKDQAEATRLPYWVARRFM